MKWKCVKNVLPFDGDSDTPLKLAESKSKPLETPNANTEKGKEKNYDLMVLSTEFNLPSQNRNERDWHKRAIQVKSKVFSTS